MYLNLPRFKQSEGYKSKLLFLGSDPGQLHGQVLQQQHQDSHGFEMGCGAVQQSQGGDKILLVESVPVWRALPFFYAKSSDYDLIFLEKASMGLKTICKRKKDYSMREKYLIKKYLGNSVDFFYIDIWIFILQNAINTFFNLYYDYWDLITKFWPGSSKWNTPFQQTNKLLSVSFKNLFWLIVCSTTGRNLSGWFIRLSIYFFYCLQTSRMRLRD